jgi:hypothetical protein
MAKLHNGIMAHKAILSGFYYQEDYSAEQLAATVWSVTSSRYKTLSDLAV